MKTRKRFAIAAFLVLSAFVGTQIWLALASRHRQNLSPRPTREHFTDRTGMSVSMELANTGGPGQLVVSGALAIGDPDLFPNHVNVAVRVTAPDGTVLVNEIVGRCDVAKDVHQTEYPVRRVYSLPPGMYYVELMAFERDHPIKAPDGTIEPQCGTGWSLAVN